MYYFAGIYQQNLMSEMASQVKEIGQVVKETRNLVDEQHLEERKKEILYVTDLWKNERENYPDWYIPPYHICCELKWSFEENQLLQPSKEISLEELLEFAYELVWRYETGMKLYESYERLRLRAIWDDYRLGIDDLIKQLEQAEDKQADIIKEHIRHWFYIGQALLREYREEGMREDWQELYKELKPYGEYGLNGVSELQMEKIKFHFMNFELRSVKKLLEKWDIPSEQYEIRLQAAGMWAELGDVETALQRLRELGECIDHKRSEIENDETNQKERLRLYRILDKLALPLQCNHVTLMNNIEFPWIEALVDIKYQLAFNMLIRGANSKNVKDIINRSFLAGCNQDIINNTIIFLKDLLENNLEEIGECNVWGEGNIYTCILEHVPSMLTRYLTRCPESLQPDMMMLLKKMTNMTGFDLRRHMDEFTADLMHCISRETSRKTFGKSKAFRVRTTNGDSQTVDFVRFRSFE